MKYIKIQFCICATLLCLFLHGCGKGWSGREVIDMAFKNNANYPITVYSEIIPPINFYDPIVYPDTTLPYQFPQLKMRNIQPGFFYIYSQTETDIPTRFGDLNSDTISIFVFSTDTLSLLGWEAVRDRYNIIQRYDISLNEYISLYTNLPTYEFPSFPPTPEMRNIKMWPPYGTYDSRGFPIQ